MSEALGLEARATKRATPPTERIIFSEKFACPVSGFTIPEIEPRLFSFNNPFGACPVCDGLGTERRSTPTSSCPTRPCRSRENAVAPWAKTSSPYYMQTLEALARHYKFSTDKPWAELPEQARQAILYGTGEEEVTFTMTTACAPTRRRRPSRA